ncbi:MAG: 4-hydroxy-tetrahydrodipicolinate reductase [Spirochaetales bacterium]|nr:4-hydroxy-tetrahydrodipicolinate reductase [Spirochaetales bacterium]
MNIAIVGYGRMGREIDAIAAERGHRVTCRVDPTDREADYPTVRAAVDAGAIDGETAVIEFSLPSGPPQHVAVYGEVGCSVVIGTTGWDAERSAVLAAAKAAGIGLVWGANFSVGAEMLKRVTGYATDLACRVGDYDQAVVELHHRNKRDSPSGTALAVAEEVLSRGTKTTVHVETLHRAPRAEELHVTAARVGSMPGTHTVYYDSPADTLEITHRARNRGGFARGAVQAAEWIERVGGVRTVGEFFDDLFR